MSFQSRVLKGTGGFKARLRCSLLMRGTARGVPAEIPSALPRTVPESEGKQPDSAAAWKPPARFAHQYPEGGDKRRLITSPKLGVSCSLVIYLKAFRKGESFQGGG